jgi:endo-alpha-1,4-polygalactosaminidase (GH114 family)
MLKGITWNNIPSNGLVVVEGQRGEGKTSLAWYIAELKRVTKKGKRVIAFGMPVQARKALPKWITHMNTLEEVSTAKPSIVIIDEAAFTANSRRAMQESNIEWLQLIAICRHKDHLLIFVSQHNRQLDVQILADADLVIMKKPSLLHLRFTRPEFKPELEQAYEQFQAIKGDTRKFAYVVDYHNGNAKMLKCKLPKFWSERISKAYSEMAIGLDTKPVLPELTGIEEKVSAYAQTEIPTPPKKRRGRPPKTSTVQSV